MQALAVPGVNSALAVAKLQEAGGRILVSDRVFLHAPGKSLFKQSRLEPHETRRPPSWGALTSRLQDWLEVASPDLGRTLEQGRPVTLHITHSWGGGVALWTSTFIGADRSSSHLQLRSEEPQSGQGYGQLLNLYAADELSCPIASWWLQPPIRSIENSNTQYLQVLKEICSRYGVGRILVSSLVGHSLDVLRTGLPTLQVLHDHFPTWPFLSAHPGDYLNMEGKPDLAKALADRRLIKEFTDRNAGSWMSLRDEYLAALEANNIRVAAPGQSVIDLQTQLDRRWNDIPIQLIPTWFSDF